MSTETTIYKASDLEYFYMKVACEFSETLEIPKENMKMHIQKAVGAIFGEVGQSADISLLQYDDATHHMILRVPSRYVKQVRIALTMNTSVSGTVQSVFRVEQISGSLLSLAANSRDFNFKQPSAS